MTRNTDTRHSIVIGPRIWAPALIGVVLWAAVGVWLDGITGWPGRYGFRCSNGCLFQDMWYSPVLLHGGFYERLVFLHLWLPFVLIAAFAVWLKIRRSNQISHPDPE